MSGKLGQKSRKPTDVAKRFRRDFLELMDGRVAAVKTLHERLSALVSDLGGLDALSYQERSLCKRVIHLERLIEKTESTLACDGSVDLHAYFAAVNALSGLFSKLGLKRRVKTVSLNDYLHNRPASPSSATKEHDDEHH